MLGVFSVIWHRWSQDVDSGMMEVGNLRTYVGVLE